jgi:glycerophosphoryl diester phosphodiesterase
MEMMPETTTTHPSRPLVIAHRGASVEAPENTIAAFELAITQGADAIELDVQLSRDDQPVVIHDPALERTTSGTGRVRDLTVRELKRLDAGGWRGGRFQGQRIQTLQEVFERFRDRVRFWIELKGGSDLYPGIEDKVVSMIEVYDVLEQALVQSFDGAALQRISALNPEIRLGILAATPPINPLIGSASACRAICPDAHLVSEAEIALIRHAGLECYVWTVNEPAQMDRLVELGVSGIITDRPDLLRARIDR